MIVTVLLRATALPTPPVSAVVAMTADQTLATLNAAWVGLGEPRFAPHPDPHVSGSNACSGGLCVRPVGRSASVATITLTGPAGDRGASERYLAAQSLLVRLVAPGAPVLPAVTADRIAVSGSAPAEAQLGPTCMRVQRSEGSELSTEFSRRRCSVDRPPIP